MVRLSKFLISLQRKEDKACGIDQSGSHQEIDVILNLSQGLAYKEILFSVGSEGTRRLVSQATT